MMMTGSMSDRSASLPPSRVTGIATTVESMAAMSMLL